MMKYGCVVTVSYLTSLTQLPSQLKIQYASLYYEEENNQV